MSGPGLGALRGAERRLPACGPPGPGRHLPYPPPPPHTSVHPAGSVAKKCVDSVCVCVCFVLTGRKIGGGGLLVTQTPVPGEPAQARAVVRGQPGLPSRGLLCVLGLRLRARDPTDKTTPLCFTPKNRPALSPVLPGLRLGQRCPLRGRTRRFLEPRCCWPRGCILPFPLPQRNLATFRRRGHLSHRHPSPQTAFPGGDPGPRAVPASRGSRPLLAARAAPAGSGAYKSRFPGPRSGNQGAPGPGTAKTRRGCAGNIRARHPFSATGSATIGRRAEVRPAQPGGVPALREDRGRSANARTPRGRERWLGGQSRG
ncbi:uncharacterized protein LOC118525330 [Halichoerus grypus]